MEYLYGHVQAIPKGGLEVRGFCGVCAAQTCEASETEVKDGGNGAEVVMSGASTPPCAHVSIEIYWEPASGT